MKKILVALLIAVLSFHSTLASDFWFEDEDLENESGEKLNPPSGKAYLIGEQVDKDLLTVEIYAGGLTVPVIGTNFSLLYETEKLSFLKYEPGEFFERGGDPFYMVQNNLDNEYVLFGTTLKRDDKFPQGDGLVGKLYFEVIGGSDFLFQFENGIFATVDTVRQDLQSIQWNDLYFDSAQSKIVSSQHDNTQPTILAIQDQSEEKTGFVFGVVISFLSLLVLFIVLFIFLQKRRKQSVNYKS